MTIATLFFMWNFRVVEPQKIVHNISQRIAEMHTEGHIRRGGSCAEGQKSVWIFYVHQAILVELPWMTHQSIVCPFAGGEHVQYKKDWREKKVGSKFRVAQGRKLTRCSLKMVMHLMQPNSLKLKIVQWAELRNSNLKNTCDTKNELRLAKSDKRKMTHINWLKPKCHSFDYNRKNHLKFVFKISETSNNQSARFAHISI